MRHVLISNPIQLGWLCKLELFCDICSQQPTDRRHSNNKFHVADGINCRLRRGMVLEPGHRSPFAVDASLVHLT